MPGADISRFVEKLGTTDEKINTFEENLYLYLSSLKNRNAVIVYSNGRERNLLNETVQMQGTTLGENDTKTATEKLSRYFDKEVIDKVSSKFTMRGEYAMFAKEIGCAMAINFALKENDSRDNQKISPMFFYETRTR